MKILKTLNTDFNLCPKCRSSNLFELLEGSPDGSTWGVSGTSWHGDGDGTRKHEGGSHQCTLYCPNCYSVITFNRSWEINVEIIKLT